MRFVWIALLVVVLAGGALRFHAAGSPTNYQSKDESAYARIARTLVLKHEYGEAGMTDPVHWVPGAPLMFAAAYALDSDRPFSKERPDIPTAYTWQAAVGTLLILATFALGLALAGPTVGLVAAAAVAFYPPLITASADLLSEPLGALGATLALAMTVWAIRDPGRRRWKAILAGVLFAGTLLTRADLVLLPLIAALAITAAAWRAAPSPERRPQAKAAGRAVAPFLAALVLCLLPWTVYASQDAGTFVPLSNGGGSNFFIGTYLPGDGRLFGAKKALAEETKQRFPELRSVEGYYQIRARSTVKAVALRRPELSEEASLKAAGFENLRLYALGQPLDFAGMMASKVWRLWGAYSVGGGNNERTPAVLAYHRVLVFLGFAGLLLGLVVTRRKILLLPLGALLYVSALNAILVSESRHNLTLIPTLACGGAAGALFTYRFLRERRAASAAAGEPVEPTGANAPAAAATL